RPLKPPQCEQRHRLNHAGRHARPASAGDSGRAGSEIGGGKGTAEGEPPAGRLPDETDYVRFADPTSGPPAVPAASLRLGSSRFPFKFVTQVRVNFSSENVVC